MSKKTVKMPRGNFSAQRSREEHERHSDVLVVFSTATSVLLRRKTAIKISDTAASSDTTF
jgi:hypothetical protein